MWKIAPLSRTCGSLVLTAPPQVRQRPASPAPIALATRLRVDRLSSICSQVTRARRSCGEQTVKLVLPAHLRAGHGSFTGSSPGWANLLIAMKGRRADIHFHLLPGVDHGAANLEETVELARLAEIDGTD